MSQDNTINIESVNPSKEEGLALADSLTSNLAAAQLVEFKFKRFKDEKGDTYLRTPLTLAIPFPTLEGVITFIEKGGKEAELLLEAVSGIIQAKARELISSDMSLNYTNFPYEKLLWESIANEPKVDRRATSIPKETWEAFAASYIAYMPEATGKSVKAVTNAAAIFTNKLQQVKSQKNILQILVEQLSIYAASPDASDYADCVDFLLKKAEAYLEAEEVDLLSAL